MPLHLNKAALFCLIEIYFTYIFRYELFLEFLVIAGIVVLFVLFVSVAF